MLLEFQSFFFSVGKTPWTPGAAAATISSTTKTSSDQASRGLSSPGNVGYFGIGSILERTMGNIIDGSIVLDYHKYPYWIHIGSICKNGSMG
jgi:hypothetical protein